MRQLNVRKKKKKIKLLDESTANEVSVEQDEDQNDSRNVGDDENMDDKVVKEGNEEELDGELNAVGENKSAEILQFYTESTHPLAMYEAQWMPIEGMVINISLVEQKLNMPNRIYWLRVGVMFVGAAGAGNDNDSDSATPKGTLGSSKPLRNLEDGGKDLPPPSAVADTATVAEEVLNTNAVVDGYSSAAADAGCATTGEDGSTTGISMSKNSNKSVSFATITSSPVSIVAAEEDKNKEGGEENPLSLGCIPADPVEEELYPLAMLSGNAARFMIPEIEDWVELHAIDPLEFYMAQHMQRVMQSIACRVVITNLNELAFKQEYTVAMVHRRQKVGASAAFFANTGIASMSIKRPGLDVSMEPGQYNAVRLVVTDISSTTKEDGSNPAGDVLSRTQSAVSVNFQDWTVQVSHRIRLTRGISVQYYPARVKLSFRYANRLTDPYLSASSPSLSSPYSPSFSSKGSPSFLFAAAPAGGGGDNDEDAGNELHEHTVDVHNRFSHVDSDDQARVKARNKKNLEKFNASKKVTHFVLNVSPAAADLTGLVPSAVLTFDMASMLHLLGQEAPQDVDEILEEGKREPVLKLAHQLANVIRFEYTTEGVKYSVVGAFTQPERTTCSWPIDEPTYFHAADEELSDGDDDQHSAMGFEEEEEEEEEEEGSGVEEKEEGEDNAGNAPVEVVEEGIDHEAIVAEEDEEEEEEGVEPSEPDVVAQEMEDHLEDIPVTAQIVCPRHQSSTCACLRLHITLQGSDLCLFGEFATAPNGVIGSGTNSSTMAINEIHVEGLEHLHKLHQPEQQQLEETHHSAYEVECVNQLYLSAVDCLDTSMNCELVVRASEFRKLIRDYVKPTSSSSSGGGGEGTAGGSSATTTGINVSSYSPSAPVTTTIESADRSGNSYCKAIGDTIYVDVLEHSTLQSELFHYTCTKLDLFLSRKIRLMKLQIKHW